MEFVTLNRVKLGHLTFARKLLMNITDNFKKMRYLTIEQCYLCKDFTLLLKTMIDVNESLVRISIIMNKIAEEDMLVLLKACMEHPELEVI